MIERSTLTSIGRRVRTNHALEHATITVLSGRIRDVVLRGRSNRNGFYIFGDVSTQAVREAVSDALGRLQAGETELAIHPFCGTNLAVAGILAGCASAVAIKSSRRGEGVPASILAALLALVAAQPIGIWAQRNLTTDGSVGNLHVDSVREVRFLGKRFHFVSTSR